jgi:uncharacterized membrane protein YcaP (DUF421 family)
LIGARGVGQLSMAEFTLIIALGSAVGDPMLYFDIPLIYGMIVLTFVVVFQRILSWLSAHTPLASKVMDNSPVRLVSDGVLELEGLHVARLLYLELAAELRRGGAEDLAQVRRAYLETDGKVSVFLFENGKWSPSEHSMLKSADGENGALGRSSVGAKRICGYCGLLAAFDNQIDQTICPNCGHTEWK